LNTSACLRMQEAQASCSGGSDSPDTSPILPQSSFPCRPSISLELYNRFILNQNQKMDPVSMSPIEHSSSMDIDIPSDSESPGIPPTEEVAITPPRSLLSSRPSVDAANDPVIPKPIKKSSKRESIDIPPLASTAKKSSPTPLVESNNISNPNNSESNNNRATLKPASLSSSSTTPTSIPPTYRYNSKDHSPFIVQVQSTQESAYSHPLHISRMLSSILPRGILEIRKSGRNKVMVHTTTYEIANRLVDDKSLSSYNLKAFIPAYRVLRCGIVRDVPQDITADVLKESISSPIKILEIHRLNRRVKVDNEVRYVPSRTLCVKFSGQSLPQYVYLFNCRYPVVPFVPKTRICFSCFRVGHLSKSCKSRPRCLFCGDSAHDSSETCSLKQAPPKCINCKGDHLATSHDCIKVIEHKKAHSLAATENISFIDALRSVSLSSSFASPSSSPPSFSDPRFDYHNFPLPPKPSSTYPSSPIFSPNRFSPLYNLSPSHSEPSNPTKPFSSVLKHTNVPNSGSQNIPRNKRLLPPLLFLPLPPFLLITLLLTTLHVPIPKPIATFSSSLMDVPSLTPRIILILLLFPTPKFQPANLTLTPRKLLSMMYTSLF